MAFCYRVRLSLAALAIWPAGGAVYGQVARPPVPAKLSVPNSDFVILKALGKGKQIYRCGEKAGQPRQFAWTLNRPEADLLDADGHVIGRHFKGPAWESSDGSKVAGQVIERMLPVPMLCRGCCLRRPNTPNPAGGVLAGLLHPACRYRGRHATSRRVRRVSLGSGSISRLPSGLLLLRTALAMV